MIRTNSWKAWSTLMRSLALHSIYGMHTEHANCCASSNDTWIRKNKIAGINRYCPVVLKIAGKHLHVFDDPNRICCRREALEIHRDLLLVKFASEICWFRRNWHDQSTSKPVEILRPIAYTVHALHWTLLGRPCPELLSLSPIETWKNWLFRPHFSRLKSAIVTGNLWKLH